MRAFTARVAGRKYHNPGHAIALDSVVSLERDRGNEVDPQAVRVIADGLQVGFLEEGVAALIAPRMDRGRLVVASPSKEDPMAVNVFVLDRSDRVEPDPRATLFWVKDRGGRVQYLDDPRRRLCTCPMGRSHICPHHKIVFARNPALPPLRRRRPKATANA